MTAVLALDQGTTGSTALMLAADGRVLGRGYREFPQYFPQDGWVEHDAEELLAASVEAMREAVSASGVRPAALGIANQRETVVLWSRRTGRPVGRAIVWQDRRTTARCRELQENGREEWLRARTGLLADPYFSGTKLQWMLQQDGIERRAASGELAAGTVDSWLIWKLAGVHVTDHSNASRTLLYDLDRRDWSDELLDEFEVPRAVLPAIATSSGVVGRMGDSVLGFELPIAGVAGDQQAALLGQGCWARGSGKVTFGTGAFLLVHGGAERPVPPTGVLATVGLASDGSPEYALEGSVFIAGAALQWLRDMLQIIERADESAALAASVPDNGGVSFVPAFVGLGTPQWAPTARGTIVGLTRATNRAHVARAALESIAHSTADLLEVMEAGTDAGRALRVDGGAAENDWLLQFQADILGRQVDRPDVLDTTALGAACLAGLATGVWQTADEFMSRRTMRTFDPQMGRSERARLRTEWARAVATALFWAQNRDGDTRPPP